MEFASVWAQQYPEVKVEEYHLAAVAGHRACGAFLRMADWVTEPNPTTSPELFVSFVLLVLWVEISCQVRRTREARPIIREDKQNN